MFFLKVTTGKTTTALGGFTIHTHADVLHFSNETEQKDATRRQARGLNVIITIQSVTAFLTSDI